MGNLYNVEQHINPVTVSGTAKGSSIGIDEWNREVRKQIMEKLKHYAPEHVDKIIKATFGNLGEI